MKELPGFASVLEALLISFVLSCLFCFLVKHFESAIQEKMEIKLVSQGKEKEMSGIGVLFC